MEYNNYYPSQVGHPPPTVTNHYGGQQQMQQHQHQQQLPSPGGQMMHSPMPPQNIRQAMPPGPPTHHQQQQQQMQQQQHQQQHLGHHSQQMPPQQLANYHQIQSPHLHGQPLSHSGSPHPQPQQHHNHQASLSRPPSQQSALSSQSHHLHSQSPHHHVGPTMHMQQQQQQQLNHMVRTPPLGPSIINHTQHGLQQHTHQHQNFSTSSPIPQSNLHHYAPQQNQTHPQQQQHQSMHQHHHHPIHQQPPLVHHSPQLQHHPQVQPQTVGRKSPYSNSISPPELRIIEFNRRLQCRPIHRQPASLLPNSSSDESIWWERFASDFFEDDATLTIRIQDDKPVDYTIGRTLIPRFFRSYFDGGVTDLSISLRNPKHDSSNPHLITLDCDQAFIITHNIFKHPASGPNQGVIVHTEGHFFLEFVSNLDTLSIKSWRFYTKSCREYIDRSITNMGLPKPFLVEPLTKQGLTKSTVTYLKMCMIMVPMQDLMFHHRLTKMDPRTCLKKLLFDRYKYKGVDDIKVTTKNRRKRKPPATPAITGPTTNKKKNTASNSTIGTNKGQNNIMMSPSGPPKTKLQDVKENGDQIVDYGDDNERIIIRTENTQQEPIVSTLVSKEESVSINISAVNDNDLSNNNVESIVENHTQSPSLLQQQQQQQQHPQQVPQSVQIISPQVEQSSPQTVEQQRPQSSLPVPVNEEQVTDQINQANLTEQAELQPRDDIGQVLHQQASVSSDQAQLIDSDQISSEDLKREDTTTTTTADEPSVAEEGPAVEEEPVAEEEPVVEEVPNVKEEEKQQQPSPPIEEPKRNGSSNKQSRRRSSERKETLREGLMRTSDFVVAMKDLKCEHPALWRITTGNNLLQQFEPKTQNGVVLYENTNQYAGWNPEIKKDYVGVDVKLTQHTRNQITVERLLLNFQKLEEADQFFDKHFIIYLQILISTALDPKFWESIENEPEHHDYFITSRKIIEDITKRLKIKLSTKLKLSEASLKNVEKYPNLLIKPIDKNDKNEQQCRACNTNSSTQLLTFGNRSYDLHSYKPVKVTKTDDKDLHNSLCDSCLEIVKLYSEIHHIGWKLYNIAREKVELHRTKGKPINAILDECLKDVEWLSTIYAERDALLSKVEHIQ